jgi:hypothetical protein
MKKFINELGEVSVFKVAGEADFANVNSWVESRNGDGVVEQLAATVKRLRQSMAPNSGVHSLTTTEKEQMREGIIISMLGNKAPSPAFVTLVNLIVGLGDEHATRSNEFVAKSAPSKDMQEIRASITRLLGVVETLVQRRAGGK